MIENNYSSHPLEFSPRGTLQQCSAPNGKRSQVCTDLSDRKTMSLPNAEDKV